MIWALVVLCVLQESAVVSKDADELRTRAKVETTAGGRLRVSLDGAALYEGPGVAAKVDVIEIRRFPGKRFVTVTVDGEEQARLLAESLAPAKLPSAQIAEAAELFLRIVTDEGEMRILVVGRNAESEEVFLGSAAHGKPELHGRKDTIEVRLAGDVIFRVRRVRPAPRAVTVDDFVARLNAIRKSTGVPEVKARAELTRVCDLHALYLAKNTGRREVEGLGAHQEDPKRPGYTEEGAQAGRESVIHYFGARRELVSAVDSLAATLYHRASLLDPQLLDTGVGWAFDAEGAGIVVIHVGRTGGRAAETPILYPGPGQKDVPREFALGARETPDPVPDPKAQGGYPITAQFPWDPAEVSARLTLDGKAVEAWLSTPEKPARSDFPQGRVACLIPKQPLEPGRTYTVEMRCRRWSKTWSFTTSAK